MENFVFNNQVKLIFGTGSLAQSGTETARLGRTAMLVTGQRAVRHSGIHALVAESLAQAGCTVVDFAGAQPNPLLSHVHRGIAEARRHRCDVIVGLGGGSVIDTAKAIAAGVPAAHDVWKLFTGKKSVREALPVISIPTIAGSGSEMNSGMVLTHDEKKLKFGFAHRFLYPRVCLADPATTFSVPPDQTAYGAVDTICHCLEAYFTTAASGIMFQRRLIETICHNGIESLAQVLKDPCDYQGRASLLWLASLSLSGLPVCGLGRIAFPIHLIEHALSALFDIAHGAGLAAVLPGWLLKHHDLLAPRLCRLGQQVFDAPGLSEAEGGGQKTIELMKAFLADSGCPCCLTDLGISVADFPEIASHCELQARIWRMHDYDREKIISVLQSCR